MGILLFGVYLAAVIAIFVKRGGVVGCFSIPMALVAGVWIGIASVFTSDISAFVIPLLITAGMALMIFLPQSHRDVARAEAQATPSASSPAQSMPQPKAWVAPATVAEVQQFDIVEIERSEYLPATNDAADLAARKLDEDFENGAIDRATYVAERKKLAN